jgi:hypothetical protein
MSFVFFLTSGVVGVQVVLDCPRCLKSNGVEIGSGATAIACRHCGWTKPIADGDVVADTPRTCLVCGCGDLWRQKDFPPQLGLVIVGLGIVSSTVAVAMMRPVIGLGILMAFALADMVLFSVMRDALVCYRCHARFRHVGATDQHLKFDLELNERYRQEQARLQAAQSSQPVS